MAVLQACVPPLHAGHRHIAAAALHVLPPSMQNHECHTRYTHSSPQPAPAASVKFGVTLLACHLAENSFLCHVCPTAYDFDSPFERHKANMHSVIAVFAQLCLFHASTGCTRSAASRKNCTTLSCFMLPSLPAASSHHFSACAGQMLVAPQRAFTQTPPSLSRANSRLDAACYANCKMAVQHAAQPAPSISATRLLSLYTRNMGFTRP